MLKVIKELHFIVTYITFILILGIKRLCRIRGKMRKSVWIRPGDIILVSLRDYQDAKADVVFKYNRRDAWELKTYDEHHFVMSPEMM